MNFGDLQDMAARSALTTFRLSAEYFYEDRKTGERFPLECVEKTVEFVEQDPNDNVTIVHSGKGFLICRADWEELDMWRKDMNIDVRKEPTPFGGDLIVREMDGKTEHYEINYRETP